MSTNVNQPGPSRIKRKNSDPDMGHAESKHIAEDRTITLEDEDATKLGEYLTAEYEILLRVLNNLSAYDLRKAAQVSKSWNSAARVVRDSRHELHWLFWRANGGGWNVPPPLAISSSIREHVFSQTKLGLAFFSKTAIKQFECATSGMVCPVMKDNRRCRKIHDTETYMNLALGPESNLTTFTVSGVIGTSLDLKSTFEVENINKRRIQAMSAVFFPDLPGVKIIKFSAKKQDLIKVYREPNAVKNLSKMLGVPNDMLVQAVILLSGYRIRSDDLALFTAHLQARQEHRFAVAGGIGEKGADSIEGFMFLGDNVCAASLVINDSVTEKKVVAEQITKIKNCNLPLGNGLCFMFTCLGRGYMWYDGEEDVESGIMKNIFPKSPVVGFFGRGEIGLNFLPNFEAQDSTEFWQNFKSICSDAKASLDAPKQVNRSSDFSIDHSYSTCIMYVSFNKVSSLPF